MSRRRWITAGAVVVALAAAAGVGVVAAVGATPAAQPAQEPSSVFPLAADYCYAQMMMPHHDQAVLMSEILLEKPGISERLVDFATFVAADQAQEVETTKQWTEVWRSELRERPPQSGIVAPQSTHHGGTSPQQTPPVDAAATSADEVDFLVDCGDASVPDRFTAMAGMLTPDQLDALRAAEGLAAEILYLELMIPHHDGALAMSREALVEGDNAYIAQMARHVLVEQDREITAMRTMIEEISE